MEIGVRRRGKADEDDVKGERGRIARFFHNGGLRVRTEARHEGEKDCDPNDISLNGAQHGRTTPYKMIRVSGRSGYRQRIVSDKPACRTETSYSVRWSKFASTRS